MSRNVLLQRILGIALILFSVVIVLVAKTSKSPVMQDITPIIILIPLGLLLLFNKEDTRNY